MSSNISRSAVVEDATTLPSAEAHRFAYEHVFPLLGRVRNTEQVLASLAKVQLSSILSVPCRMNNWEILLDFVTLLGSLEAEVRSLQVLTTHRIDANTNEKLGIPEQANALHLQLESLREKVRQFSER